MRQIPNYGDRRQLQCCAFCSGPVETLDHCPSKVFLDEPYPENLQQVPACKKCNLGFSLDEEYLACILEVTMAGSVEPSKMSREKIKKILESKPKLKARIFESMSVENNSPLFRPEHSRVSNVITKLAQGHTLFYLNEPRPFPPNRIEFIPLISMTVEGLEYFEAPLHNSEYALWPEVGSRAMQNLVVENNDLNLGWMIVQPGRYRYRADLIDGITIKIVIGDYLAANVSWSD